MHSLPLRAHPATPCDCLSRFEVDVRFVPGEAIELDYRLYGDLVALRAPPPAAALRTDGLWQHTCCEIFVRVPEESRYYEWNFAPSGAWAFYGFDGYRNALPEIAVAVAPSVHWHATAQQAHLRVRVTLAGLPLSAATALQAAMSAVIETTSADRSYWALTHPSGKPDFHHPENFVLALP